MKRTLLGAGAAMVALSHIASAQTLDRSQRPVPPPERPFHFPKIQSHVLPNGLRVLVVEDHSIPLVAVRAYVNADSTLDPQGKEGLYNVMLAALREGTTSRNVDQLAEASGAIGTAVSPTSFSTTTASFAPALTLMGDMLMHPTFEQAGIDRRKAAQAARARSELAKPASRGRNAFYTLLYGRDDAVTRAFYASETSVGSIQRGDVLRTYASYVRPQNTTLIVAGDVSDATALAEAGRVFGGWAKGAGVSRVDVAPTAEVKPTTIYLVDVPGNAVYLYMGNAGPSRSSADIYAVETAGVLSANRLTQTLREEHSFIYASTSGALWHRAPRVAEFLGSTVVNGAKVDSAMTVWMQMLRDMRGAKPATAAELDAARRIRLGPLPVRIEGPDAVADRVLEIVRDALPLDYYDRYVTGMKAVSPADVAAAASRYIDVDHLVIVVTGNRAAVEPMLRAANLAPVVVIDADGKPVP